MLGNNAVTQKTILHFSAIHNSHRCSQKKINKRDLTQINTVTHYPLIHSPQATQCYNSIIYPLITEKTLIYKLSKRQAKQLKYQEKV